MPTDLQTKALAVVAATPDDDSGSRLQRAVRDLRNSTGATLPLGDYIDAVRWALAHSGAADLAVGSVVATLHVSLIKLDRPEDPVHCWAPDWFSNRHVDKMLANGAEILRVGYAGATDA